MSDHVGLFLWDAAAYVLLCTMYFLLLLNHPKTWKWIGLIFLVFILSIVPVLSGHRDHWLLSSVATFALIWLLYSNKDDDGRWKRLWGKLKSSALTAVNRASFRQQTKEAFS